jgi:hypothetical protein
MICKYCKREFEPYRGNQVHCTARCRALFYNHKAYDPEKESLRRRRKADNNLPKYLWSIAKRRAKERNLEFSIDSEDIVIPEYCPILGVKLERSILRQSPSVDRIDSSKGYIKGNVRVISHRANTIKNNSTFEELIKLLADANCNRLRN